MDDERPVTPLEADAAFRAVVAPAARGVVLAVSGGPDSTAMMWLMAQAPCRADWRISVATVDHGLRASSAEACRQVVATAGALGFPADVLCWPGAKPTARLQERARAARYELLLDHCRSMEADHLLTAHTLDDQAETVLFRLARGSGIGGLGAMRPRVSRAEVTIARPFLSVRKSRLLATCAAHGIAAHDDPANADPRFARARLRALAPALASVGVEAEGLGRLAQRAARASDALDQIARDTHERCRSDSGEPMRPRLDFARLAQSPHEIVLRVLDLTLRDAGAGAIRLERLERATSLLLNAVQVGTRFRLTLGNLLIDLDRSGTLSITPAPARHRGLSTSRP